MPATEDMRKSFGGVTNQQGEPVSVTARICILYDLLNSIVIKGFPHPYTVSEEEVVPECLSGLSLDSKLLLFDRGYPSYWLMYLLMEKGAKFVMRVASNANNAVKDFLASQATDLTIEWCPSYASLYDMDNYTEEDLKEVYHLRWGIETCYGYMKEELQLGQFSGIRRICIEQDFAANLFLFNLQSLIEKQTEP